jgi:glutathione S-transferase
MPQLDNPKSPLVPQLEGLHLFHFDAAPCAQRVRFALAEKGLVRGPERPWLSASPKSLKALPGTWISRRVSLIKADHLTSDYAAIQPNMVVPALVHNGKLFVESMDIIDYLDELYPENPLVPKDKGAAEMAEVLVERAKALHVSVRHVSFRWGLGRLGKLKAKAESTLKNLEPAGSPEQMVNFYTRYNRDEIEDATFLSHLVALETGFESLETLLRADGRAFLVGDTLSKADIIWSIKVLRLAECGYPFRERFPTLFKWYTRVSNRPAFREGVMSQHNLLHRIFRAKSGIANLLGQGLKAASSGRPGSLVAPS